MEEHAFGPGLPRLAPAGGAVAVPHGGVALARTGVGAELVAAEQLRRGKTGWPSVDRGLRIGAIVNKRAHRNAAREIFNGSTLLDWAAPASVGELDAALARFAESKIDTLVIDGGDGTIRDVLSASARVFTGPMPTIAVVPSGKTNALAIDLGVPADWSLKDAIAAATAGQIKLRSPVEVSRLGEAGPGLRGFLFGTGAFVKATALAQETHKVGAFRGLAVGMALTGGVLQTAFAGSNNHWRQGERTEIQLEDGRRLDRSLYLVLGSTLERLPLGLKPFGRERAGLKFLGIDAPPRHIVATAPMLLSGSEAGWLERIGYHRADMEAMTISVPSGFILDGELYRGGDLSVRKGAPLRFLVP
jgi:hypothetical protein